MKKLNESQLIEQARGLRDYLAQIDEAGPTYNADPKNNPANQPAGNSFDAKLAQANAAQKAKLSGTKPAQGASPAPTTPAALPKGSPGPRPSSWADRLMGSDKRWDSQYASKWNPDGTAKKTAVAAKPAAPAPQAADPVAPQAGTPAAATSVDAAKAAGADMNKDQSQWSAVEEPKSPWPAGSPQEAAYLKLSDEDKAWIGKADPTDPFILARAPNGGKPAAPAQGQGASPASVQAVPGVKAGGEVIDTRGGAQGQDEMEEAIGETTTFQNDELNRIVSLVQHR
jgi:hypothetical protein